MAMDFHAAMETFAEAWVAANTQTAVNSSDPQGTSKPLEDLPTLLPKEQLGENPPPVASRGSPPDKPTSDTAVGAGKTLPIHCLVEPVGNDTEISDKSGDSLIELDSYAILPAVTPFNEIVRTSLAALGYSATEAVGATGAIQFKNWKPLSFNAITDNTELTVEDVLGELTSVSTLRIRVCNPYDRDFEWNDRSVRNAVMEILKEMNQSNLAKLCPLSQPTISNIANSKKGCYIGKEKCREFGNWYKHYRAEHRASQEIIDSLPKDARLTFHPTKEIPLLREWYRSCKNPSDDDIQCFTDQLNRGHVRRQRAKVTTAKVKIWWKNERQREKRLSSTPDNTKPTRKHIKGVIPKVKFIERKPLSTSVSTENVNISTGSTSAPSTMLTEQAPVSNDTSQEGYSLFSQQGSSHEMLQDGCVYSQMTTVSSQADSIFAGGDIISSQHDYLK